MIELNCVFMRLWEAQACWTPIDRAASEAAVGKRPAVRGTFASSMRHSTLVLAALIPAAISLTDSNPWYTFSFFEDGNHQ